MEEQMQIFGSFFAPLREKFSRKGANAQRKNA